jgi:flagellar motor switch/type III secretory pathway protein FliN
VFDLKNLDVDDIVVFDNSKLTKMTLKFKDYEKEVNLEPNLGLVMPVDDNNNGGNNMSNTNLWDSIEVEMTAQFDSVKISLGDLKTIEAGQVVDLTSIYDNKVTLSVEGKPIAKGELVIVNDRYGVKVDELVAKSGKGGAVARTDEFAAEEEFGGDAGESFTPPPPAAAEEEEFDYSDFELEDEDI